MTDKDTGKESPDVLVTEEDVWDIMEFYRFANSIQGGWGTPTSIDLLNRRLKDITLLDTGEVTEDQVSDALEAPKDNENELLRQSEHFELVSQIYKRILNYMGNIPSFDFTFVCTNLTPESINTEVKKRKYIKEREIVRDFFDKFKYKEEFSKISRQLLRQEAFFSIFRTDGSQYVFQELPPNRSKITGKFPYGLLFSFDYNYFLEGGVDIDLYPPIFKETLNSLRTGEIGDGGYEPADTVGLRGQPVPEGEEPD